MVLWGFEPATSCSSQSGALGLTYSGKLSISCWLIFSLFGGLIFGSFKAFPTPSTFLKEQSILKSEGHAVCQSVAVKELIYAGKLLLNVLLLERVIFVHEEI